MVLWLLASTGATVFQILSIKFWSIQDYFKGTAGRESERLMVQKPGKLRARDLSPERSLMSKNFSFRFFFGVYELFTSMYVCV